MSNETMSCEEMAIEIAKLKTQVERLSQRVKQLQADRAIPEDHLAVIAATAAAALGYKGNIKAIHRRSSAWADAGRDLRNQNTSRGRMPVSV